MHGSSCLLLLITTVHIVASKFAKHAIFDVASGTDESEYLLGYAKWSDWSRCSKDCGSGIQYQLRRCLDVHCSGPSSRYRICNTQVCEKDTRTDAEIECSLKNRHHASNSTLSDRWYPVSDEERPCSLVCRAEKEGVTRDFETSLRDGSRCHRSPGIGGACFKGKCESLGCDQVIGSHSRMDHCGVCGGNGLSCKKNIFSWTDTPQYSPCDKTCGVNSFRVSVSVCTNTVTNRVVPERLCGDQVRPRPQVKSCPHVVCPVQPVLTLDYDWLESEWSSCSVSCGGGLSTRDVLCVETYSDLNSTSQAVLENRKVDDHYCWQTPKPRAEQVCGADECPKWVTGDWNLCSTSCGTGLTRRTVKCQHEDRIVDDIVCRIVDRPLDSQKCFNNVQCSANLKELTGGQATNSIQNEEHYRFVAESPFSQWNDRSGGFSLQEEPARLLHGFTATADKTKPRFYPGVWSDCSTSCGPGIRTRTVECVAFQSITSSVLKLPDYECEGEAKPSLFQPCQTQVCPQNSPQRRLGQGEEDDESNGVSDDDSRAPRGNFRWDYGEWGDCSASCLGGKQRSTLKCIDSRNKVSVPWSQCDAKRRPIDLWRDCNKTPCPPGWDVGDWGECSHPCGGGLRTRKARCTRQMAKAGGAESTLILPDAQCPAPKPAHQEACGLSDCQMTWRVDQWSPCSASCSPGEQRRQIYCEKRLSNGQVRVFEAPECAHLEKPPTVQLCDLGACDGAAFTYNVDTPPAGPEPLIRPYSDDSNRVDANFDQSNRHHKKLTLNIGGLANLYKGTSIKVKCPVKNFDRSKIHWTKDGSPIENNAHIRVSSNGALRVFHARMEDAGVYACHANGAQGNVTLRFKHREAEGHALDEADMNRTKPKHFPDNTRYDVEEAVEDGLDRAPTEALSPTEVDLALIGKVKASLEKLNELRFAAKLRGVTEPGKLKVDYRTGFWSPCSQQSCGVPDGAQVRLVKCRVAFEHATAYVDDDVCEAYEVKRPPSTKACHNPDCPEWEATDWSDCMASRCVKHHTSIQRREVKCVYLNGTDAEFTLCNRKTRPKIKKECVNPNCTAEWKPSIWGKCSRKCGEGGVQMRLLRCVWKGTRKAAGRNCDAATRPSAIRSCAESPRPCLAGEGVDGAKFPKEHQSQSNASPLGPEQSLSSPSLSAAVLSDEPFKKLQKWRGWHLYKWDWDRLDDKLRRF